jgi:hypothetical protein
MVLPPQCLQTLKNQGFIGYRDDKIYRKEDKQFTEK